jgi:hypothetical protein
MADKAWKRSERVMAKDVGCQRIPVTGERHGADFRTALFAYQLKVRRVIPQWLFTWLSGICTTAAPNRVGVLVLNRPQQPRRDAIVILRWSDWVDLHGDHQELEK